MRNLICFCSFLLTTGLYAQQDTVLIQYQSEGMAYQTDTVIFETPNNRTILYGTTVMPSTHNQIEVWGSYGLKLEKISKSDCLNHGEEAYKNDDKVNSIIETDSSFIVDINIYDNCCYEFLCDAGVNDAGTLNLIFYGYSSMYCACDCCFGLVYHFRKEDFDDMQKVTAVQINGDANSLKKVGR